MLYKKFILDSFKLLDDGNYIEFISQLSEDILWTTNKKLVNQGKTSVKSELNKLYSSLYEFNHHFLNVWEVDDTYIITADLSVKAKDKSYEDIPWTSVVKIKEGKISEIQVFSEMDHILN